MKRRPALSTAIIVALLAAVAVVVARPALSAATPVRIMPLGDSITAGPGVLARPALEPAADERRSRTP